MKKLVITKRVFAFVSILVLTACSQQSKGTATETKMPQDCEAYFDGLRELAKDNENLANKFGEKLAQADKAWQGLSEQDRQQFAEVCTVRNQQLKELKGTPELEKLLNEL